MRFSRRQGVLGTCRAPLVTVLLTAGAMAGGLLAQTSSAGASPAAKGVVTIGSKTYKFPQAICLGSSSHIETTLTDGPNSVEIAGKVHNGRFTNAIFGITLNGKELLVAPNSGTSNSHGGTFKGIAGSSTKVKGSYSC